MRYIDGCMVKNNMIRVRVHCPDNIIGCAVVHYKWILLDEYLHQNKKNDSGYTDLRIDDCSKPFDLNINDNRTSIKD